MVTSSDLEAIEARASAATPGPWAVDPEHSTSSGQTAT